jgi:DMSO reductase anchor subunit
MQIVSQSDHITPDVDTSPLPRVETRAGMRNAGVVVLFLFVLGNLILVTMGFLSGLRPHGHVLLFLAWVMGITALIMLARLWRALEPEASAPPREPTT